MSANDYYGKPEQHGQQPPQGGYYPPPQGPPPGQGGYYPQQPPQSYQQGGYYQGPPQQGYAPQPQPQTVYVQEQKGPAAGGGCMACLAGICLCCCAEEICDCIF